MLLSNTTKKEVLDSRKVSFKKDETMLFSGKVEIQHLPATIYIILAGSSSSTAAMTSEVVIFSAFGISRSPYDYIAQYTFDADFDGYVNLVARSSDVSVTKEGYIAISHMTINE